MLHTVNKSPYEKSSLQTCLRLSAPGSHVLLIEDGVYGALRGGELDAQLTAPMNARNLYALGADLTARGIPTERLRDGIEVIDYDHFVKLAVQCGAVQSWF